MAKSKNNKKFEICDVYYYDDKKIAFNFKGYGIITENIHDIKHNKIKVSYVSDIGKPDFIYNIEK